MPRVCGGVSFCENNTLHSERIATSCLKEVWKSLLLPSSQSKMAQKSIALSFFVDEL